MTIQASESIGYCAVDDIRRFWPEGPQSFWRVASVGVIDKTRPYHVRVESPVEAGFSYSFTLVGLPPQWRDDWHGFAFEWIGMRVSSLPSPPEWPYWRFYPDDQPERSVIILRLLRQRVAYRNSPLYAEALWLPNGVRNAGVMSADPDSRRDPRDVRMAERALRLIQEIRLRSHGGRRPKEATAPPKRTIPNHEFPRRYHRVYQKLRQALQPSWPRQADVAAELGISERTLQRQINETGEVWPPRQSVKRAG